MEEKDLDCGGETSNSRDRFSDLPPDILCRILSCIPVTEAVRTNCLSKNWKLLWGSTVVVDLDENRFSKLAKEEIINGSWMGSDTYDLAWRRKLEEKYQLEQEPIRNYRPLCFLYYRDIRFISCVEQWNSFLQERKVSTSTRHLPRFPGRREGPDRIRFKSICDSPPFPFLLKSLKGVKTYSSPLRPSIFSNSQSFSSLEIAFLFSVRVQHNSLSYMISNCPCLVYLHLKNCSLPTNVVLCAPESKLKCLILDRCNSEGYPLNSLNICLPSLLRFEFVGLPPVCFSATNLSNLLDADVGFESESSNGNYKKMFSGLFQGLGHARVLRLSSWCLEVISKVEPLESLAAALENLKHLMLKTRPDNREFLCVAWLLRNCPNMEALSIDLGGSVHVSSDNIDPFGFVEEAWLELQLLRLDWPLHYLKKVQINNYQCRNNEIVFVKYLLKNSLILKELIISPKNLWTPELMPAVDQEELNSFLEKLKTSRKLILALPRISVHAQVSLSEDFYRLL
ncbi:putative F-box/LRR-repeat protein At5g54820 [Telopea speciosissima]|uniref:putative F-box/LRR-repeat protein At5g54820 n=1 Tax=Telopea speciosissima TaxID=54955 RepID=UPI001CC463AB|nr:putative F-box/LRR-repeat protein At5g54820 [Telopea speciosissima]